MGSMTRRKFALLAVGTGVAVVAAKFARGYDRERQANGVTYRESPEKKVDVYAPEPDGRTDRPVVVYFFGGAWQSGGRTSGRDIGETLALRDMVAITPDYGIYPKSVFPGFLDDAAAAVRWARDHAKEYGGDPQRIIVMGHSSGAHVASMIATDSRYLDAHGMSKAQLAGMVGLAGPYAAIPTTDPHMDEIFPAALRSRALPLPFVNGEEPPMLLAAGTNDTDVNPRNSDQFADALLARHDRVELKKYPGLGHDSMVLAFRPSDRASSPVVTDVAAFIAGCQRRA
jgi:acetyl esterase/lipase